MALAQVSHSALMLAYCDVCIFQHPGGAEVLMENGGRDASNQFRSVGHSDAALKMLDAYLVGILPEDERFWDTAPLSTSI